MKGDISILTFTPGWGRGHGEMILRKEGTRFKTMMRYREGDRFSTRYHFFSLEDAATGESGLFSRLKEVVFHHPVFARAAVKRLKEAPDG